jgi:hypothetical protein
MPILTARRFATGFLAASILSVPVAATATPAAHAEVHFPAQKYVQVQKETKVKKSTPKWKSRDKRLMHQANLDCQGVSSDVQYEFCVIGDFHLYYNGPRVITGEDYTYSSEGEIVLLQANGKVA